MQDVHLNFLKIFHFNYILVHAEPCSWKEKINKDYLSNVHQFLIKSIWCKKIPHFWQKCLIALPITECKLSKTS